MTEWSPQQADALGKVAAWHKAGNQQIMRVFGFAGTGKTTLARHFAGGIKGSTRFAAFTGKAAMVMRKSGCADANTIHSLIYQAVQNPKTGQLKFHLDKHGPVKDAALVVVDECSMVDEALGQDLLSYGKPVLVLGDPAQLPPVSGGGFFTDHEPDCMLTEIHRQAEGNPIVKLATDVREGRGLTLGKYGSSRVICRDEVTADLVTGADQVLVGKNVTRHQYNLRMRTLKGIDSRLPVSGDRVICLKNDRSTGIFNGGIFVVHRAGPVGSDGCISLDIRSEDFPGRAAISVKVRQEFFTGGSEAIDWRELRGTQQFNFGYAVTVHKAQGSQWERVVLFDESGAFRESAQRWLYTGITRAAGSITIVSGEKA